MISAENKEEYIQKNIKEMKIYTDNKDHAQELSGYVIDLCIDYIVLCCFDTKFY